jgi:subtilase family serine protease
LSYIPEGGWNEPLKGSTPQVAASGGGVSSIIPTPSWQIGTGVPAARSGRYTPDIAFSASCHDGYFACFAAAGNGCVIQNGSYRFEYFCGTSAAAPDMAGITALLDQQMGSAQGNLNPQLYGMAANSSTSAAFHDVTPATSGVANCSIYTPSMCNNSIPSPTGLTGGQAGYPLTVGYDEVTGLGSLDVSEFVKSWAQLPTAQPATVSPATIVFPVTTMFSPSTKTVVLVNTASRAMGISGIVVTGSGASSFTQSNNCGLALAGGASCSIQVSFAPSAIGPFSATLTFTDEASNSPQSVLLSGTGVAPSTATLTPVPASVAWGGSVTLSATVASGSWTTTLTPSGTVTFSANGHSLGTVPIISGVATLANAAVNSAGGFGLGVNQFTAVYSGDSNFSGTTAQGHVTVYEPGLPMLISMYPQSTSVGYDAQLTLTGANFNSGSVVLWNGLVVATSYVSDTQLTATIPGADIPQAAVGLVSVVNPAPNAASSTALPLLALAPGDSAGAITSVSIAPASDSSGNYLLTVSNPTMHLLDFPAIAWNGSYLTSSSSASCFGDGEGVIVSVVPASMAAVRPAVITVGSYSPYATFTLQ